MGKKSKRNKKNNAGSLRRGLAAVPTAAPAAPASNISDTNFRLMEAQKYDEVLKVESKYRHLDTFSDDPAGDVHILYAFGDAIYADLKDEACLDRAIRYHEKAKERIDANANYRSKTSKLIESAIGMNLAGFYSAGRDMKKTISTHRWLLANGNRDEVTARYVIQLSDRFNLFEKFEYTIEVLEGSVDMMETLEEEVQAETNLIRAYIGCGEFLKAKAANKKRISTDINHFVDWFLSGRIEYGLCNYEAAIAHYRKYLAEVQKQEYESLSASRFDCSMDLAITLLRHSADNEAEAFAIFQEELDRCVNLLDADNEACEVVI